MEKFKLGNRPEIYFGQNQIENLEELLKNYNNILLIYGQGSIKKSGLYDTIINKLQNKNIFELQGITPNPKLSDVEKGIKLCKDNNADFILAIGGGSVIDCAKAVALGSKSSFNIWDIMIDKKNIETSTPLGTILTMIATGSETNDIFVILNDYKNLKRSLRHNLVSPKFSIMDPTYSCTIPKRHTRNGIIDTFSHLFEQYVNNKNYQVFDKQLLCLMQHLFEIGDQLIDDLNNYDLRKEHMLISMSGYNGDYRTILNGDWACHGLDYGLASEYNNFHGEGLAILIPNWIKYIASKEKNEKLEKLSKMFSVVFNIQGKDNKEIITNGSLYLKEKFKNLGAPIKYSDIDIILTDEKLEKMINKSQFVKPLGGTYPLSEKDIEKIYLLGEK